MVARHLALLCALLGAVLLSPAAFGSTADQARAQYDKATALEAQGKYEAAVMEYGKVLTDFADQTKFCVLSQLQTGKCLHKSGRLDDALAAFVKVVDTYPGSRRRCTAALVGRGHVYMDKRDWQRAAQEYSKVVNSYAQSTSAVAEALRGLAFAQEGLEHPDEALAALDQILSTRQADDKLVGATLYDKAVIELDSRMYNRALGTAQRILKEHADDASLVRDAKIALAQAQMLTVHNTEALKTLAELLAAPRTREEHARLIFLQAIAYWTGRGDMKQSLELLGQVISDFSDTGAADEALYHRAMWRIAGSKQYDQAMEDITPIKAAWLKSTALGEYHYAKGAFADSAAAYEQAVANRPQPVKGDIEVADTALRDLVSCYERLGDTSKMEDAKTRLDAFRASHPAVVQ